MELLESASYLSFSVGASNYKIILKIPADLYLRELEDPTQKIIC